MKIHKLTIRKDWLAGTVTAAIYKDHLVIVNKLASREDEQFLDKELAKEFADADTVISTGAKGLVIDFGGKIYDLPDESDTEDADSSDDSDDAEDETDNNSND